MKKVTGMNIGIDLGTSKITAFAQGRGIVFSEENAVAYDIYNEEIIAYGNEAGNMEERAPEAIKVIRPIVSGVISDFSVMTQILSHYVRKLCKNRIFRPNIIISTPSGITALERKAVIEASCSAGAGKVAVIDEPIISAIGAGLSIDKPYGTMVIDLGAGTTDIAIITMGTVAYSESIKSAGNDLDEAICNYLRRERNISIGCHTARKIKHTVGCAFLRSEEIEMSASGKDSVTDRPLSFSVSSTEIYHALKDRINILFEAIVRVMDQAPAELYTDICNEGIILTGAGANLIGLDKELSSRLGIKVIKAADPKNCAAKGAGYILRHLDKFNDSGYSFKLKVSEVNI